jgi:hypothetical protein
MVGVMTLLDEAQARGLTVRAEADKLVIVGPRTAAATAERLLQRKPEVLALLRPGPCVACGSAVGWREFSGTVRCAGCTPRPKGSEKVLLVTLAGGATAWVDYAEELAAHRARAADRIGQAGGGKRPD